MEHLTSIAAARARVGAWKREGRSIGFVPTMGALHRGHTTLVELARTRCDRVVASVFVNPTQFGPKEDLSKYPRDLEGDSKKLAAAGCDALFTTTPDEMYPTGFATWVTVEGLTDGLCGASRPGHFRGVTTVVTKLFNIVQPDDAFFGEKDRQQLQVIKRMTADLDLPIRVHGCPTIRERDGLAMSSRNMYLSPEDRQRAVALSRGLRAAREAFARGEQRAPELARLVRGQLESVQARVDYVEVVDLATMKPVQVVNEDSAVIIAAFIGNTRLIDNHRLGDPFPA
jgi:pantoate--beta-alanine ligase